MITQTRVLTDTREVDSFIDCKGPARDCLPIPVFAESFPRSREAALLRTYGPVQDCRQIALQNEAWLYSLPNRPLDIKACNETLIINMGSFGSFEFTQCYGRDVLSTHTKVGQEMGRSRYVISRALSEAGIDVDFLEREYVFARFDKFGYPRKPSLTAEDHRLRRATLNLVRGLLGSWCRELQEFGAEPCVGGSLASGLYCGPLQDLQGQKLVEVDLRIALRKGVDPCDPAVTDKIMGITGLRVDRLGFKNRCGARRISTTLRGFSELEKGVWIELETAVRNGGFPEVARYWHVLFYPEEVKDQREKRFQLRQSAADYDQISALKRQQTETAVVRLQTLWRSQGRRSLTEQR